MAARPSLRELISTPFVLLILAYQVLSALGSQLADFLVFDRAAAQFVESADLARFLAAYTAAMNIVSIGFLVLLAGPLLRRFGLRLGIAANPVVLMLFAAAMVAVNAISGGASIALLAVVSAARIADIALTDGTTRTSINAIYQVLPERSRLAVQTAVEGIGVPVAIGISGILILVLNALPFALTATIVVTTLVCVAWVWVGVLLYRAYGPALVQALHRRPLLVPFANVDATAEDEAETLALLAGVDTRSTRLGLDLLATMSSPGLAAELGGLARDPRPDIRLSALAALAGSGDTAAGRRLSDEVADHLDDEDLAVRCAALDAVQATDVFAIAPAIAALRDPRSAGAAAGAIGRLGNAVVPALAELLDGVAAPAPPVVLRLVRASATQTEERDELLRRHVGHPDRELALAVTERLVAPEPANVPTAAALEAVLNDDLRHATRIVATLATLDEADAGPGAHEPQVSDEPLQRALRDELDLAVRKVRADVLARHGTTRLGPAVVELTTEGPLGARHAARRSNAALALEALAVLLGPDHATPLLALLEPDVSISERLRRLRGDNANDGPDDLTGWLRDLVEDLHDDWRSPWLRACAMHAASGRGLLDTFDLGRVRALGDPIVNEVLAGP